MRHKSSKCLCSGFSSRSVNRLTSLLSVISNPKRYLYDIKNDPQQKTTLDLENEENKRLAKKMEEEVIKCMERQNDGFLKNWNSELWII